jgi:hypothetical protein
MAVSRFSSDESSKLLQAGQLTHNQTTLNLRIWNINVLAGRILYGICSRMAKYRWDSKGEVFQGGAGKGGGAVQSPRAVAGGHGSPPPRPDPATARDGGSQGRRQGRAARIRLRRRPSQRRRSPAAAAPRTTATTGGGTAPARTPHNGAYAPLRMPPRDEPPARRPPPSAVHKRAIPFASVTAGGPCARKPSPPQAAWG